MHCGKLRKLHTVGTKAPANNYLISYILIYAICFKFLQLDKLYRQHGIHRDPAHELRSVCFTALQVALDTKRPKFVTMGLNGLHVSNHTHICT